MRASVWNKTQVETGPEGRNKKTSWGRKQEEKQQSAHWMQTERQRVQLLTRNSSCVTAACDGDGSTYRRWGYVQRGGLQRELEVRWLRLCWQHRVLAARQLFIKPNGQPSAIFTSRVKHYHALLDWYRQVSLKELANHPFLTLVAGSTCVDWLGPRTLESGMTFWMKFIEHWTLERQLAFSRTSRVESLRSSMGSQKGFLGHSVLPFAIFIAIVRHVRPKLVIHECTRNFRWKIFRSAEERAHGKPADKVFPGYSIHHIFTKPQEYGWPVRRTRSYTAIIHPDLMLSVPVEDMYRLFIFPGPKLDVGIFLIDDEAEVCDLVGGIGGEPISKKISRTHLTDWSWNILEQNGCNLKHLCFSTTIVIPFGMFLCRWNNCEKRWPHAWPASSEEKCCNIIIMIADFCREGRRWGDERPQMRMIYRNHFQSLSIVNDHRLFFITNILAVNPKPSRTSWPHVRHRSLRRVLSQIFFLCQPRWTMSLFWISPRFNRG